MADASTATATEGQPPDLNVLPDAATLEKWMMSAAKESDRSASFLRRMLQMNPGYGRYLSKDQELCGIVELFAKRFRHVVVGAPSPLQPGSLFKPCCELVWRVIGLTLSSITEDSDSSVPVSKDAQGQFKMLLQTNLELSEKLKESRRAYLRELSEHRDKQRKLSESVLRTVANLHEHPIMFYEPLEFVLDEATKEFVRNVVEERVKLELRAGFSEDVVNEEVSKHMQELEEQIEGMTADIRRLTNASMRDEHRANAAEEKLELQRQECERWKNSMKLKEEEADELNSKLDAMEDTLGQRCSQIADLEKQSERLQGVGADTKGAFDEMRLQLDAQLDETKALQQKLEQLEQDKQAKCIELAAANAQVEAMTTPSLNVAASVEKVEVVEKIVYFEDKSIREQLDKHIFEVQELRDAKAVLENELQDERQHVWQLSESVELLAQQKEVFLEEAAKRKLLESEREATSNSDPVVQTPSDEEIHKAVQEVSMRHEQVTKEQQATIDRLLAELQTAQQISKEAEEKMKELQPRGKEEPQSPKALWKAKYQELSGQHEELQSKYARMEQELAMVVEKLKEVAGAEEIEDTLKKIRTTVSEIVCENPRKPAYLRLHEDAQRRIAEKNEREESLLRVDRDNAQALVSATQSIRDSKSLVEVSNLWQRAGAVSKLNRVAAAMSGQFTKAVTNFQEVQRQSLQLEYNHNANLEGCSPKVGARARWQQAKSHTIDCRGIDGNATLQPDSPSAVMPAQLRQAIGALGLDHPASLDVGSPKASLLARFRQARSRTMDSRAMDNNAILPGDSSQLDMPAQLQQGLCQTTDKSAMPEALRNSIQQAAAQQLPSQQLAAMQGAAQQADFSAQQAGLASDEAVAAQVAADKIVVGQARLVAQQEGHSPEQQVAAEQKAVQLAARQEGGGQQARVKSPEAGLPAEQQLAAKQIALRQVMTQQVTTQTEGGSTEGSPPGQQIAANQSDAQQVILEDGGLAPKQAGLSFEQQAMAEQNAAHQADEQQAAGQQEMLVAQQTTLPIKQQVVAQRMAAQHMVGQQRTTPFQAGSTVNAQQEKLQNMDSRAMNSAAQKNGKQELAQQVESATQQARPPSVQQIAAAQAAVLNATVKQAGLAAKQAGFSPVQQVAAEQNMVQQLPEQRAAEHQAALSAQQAGFPMEYKLTAEGLVEQQMMQQATTQTAGASCGEIKQMRYQNINGPCIDKITSVPETFPQGCLPVYPHDGQLLTDAVSSPSITVAGTVTHEGTAAPTNMTALARQALAKHGSCSSLPHRGSLGKSFRQSQSPDSQVVSAEAGSILAFSKDVSPSQHSLTGVQPLLPLIGATPSASSSPQHSAAPVRPALVLPQLSAPMNDSAGLMRENALVRSQSMPSKAGGLASSSLTFTQAQSCPMGKLHPVLQRLYPIEPEASLQVPRAGVPVSELHGSSAHQQKPVQDALSQQWHGSRAPLGTQAQSAKDVELFEQALQAAERAGVELPDFLGHGLCISSLTADLDGTQGGFDSLAALAMSLNAFGLPVPGFSPRSLARDLDGLTIAGCALGPSGTLSPAGGGFPSRPRFNSGIAGDSPIDKATYTMDRFSQVSKPSRSGLYATIPPSLPASFEEIWQRPQPPDLSIGFNPACPSQKPLRPGGETTPPNLAGANLRDPSLPTWSSSTQPVAVPLPKSVSLKCARSAPDLTLTGIRKDTTSEAASWDSSNRKSRSHKKDRGEAANAGTGTNKARELL